MKPNQLITQPLFLFPLLLAFALVLAACPGATPVPVAPPPAATVAQAATSSESITSTESITPTEGITATDDTTATGGTTAAGMATAAGVVGAENALVSASTLLNYNFENIDGEVSGELDDLLLDMSTGRVLFTIVKYGGVLNIGTTQLPMPLSAFQIGAQGELVLNFDEQELENFPDVGGDWPNLTTGTWDDEVNNYWRGINIDPGFDFAETSGTVVRASDMVNFGIADIGLGTSTVQDMIIDLATAQIRYIALGNDTLGLGAGVGGAGTGVVTDTVGAGTDVTNTAGTGMGLGELILLPLSVFDMGAFGQQLILSPDLDLETLRNAPRMASDVLTTPGQLDPTFDTDLESYWTERGFEIEAMAE